MLAFGLTLLGGCVTTDAVGHPEELLFPAHSIRLNGFHATEYLYISKDHIREQDLTAGAHSGVYIAENLVKSGARESYACWGIRGALEGSSAETFHNTLMLSMCAKNGIYSEGIACHVDWTRKSLSGTSIARQKSLYVSGQGLISPRFILHIHHGVLDVTDSFNGAEETTITTIPDDIAYAPIESRVALFSTIQSLKCDFVASSYRNESLGVRQLTLPMRSLPAGFSMSTLAVHEFQTQTLIEL